MPENVPSLKPGEDHDADPKSGEVCAPKIQIVWAALLAATVLAGPWFLPVGATRAPLTKTGPMSSTDSIFREYGAGEDMTAKTVAAVRATRGIRPILAIATEDDAEGSYLANLIQSVAWPRVVAVRYLGSALPADWRSEFDAMILCHRGEPPVGARVIERDVVIIDAREDAR
jgi:hypothetical protein